MVRFVGFVCVDCWFVAFGLLLRFDEDSAFYVDCVTSFFCDFVFLLDYLGLRKMNGGC